MKKFIQGLNSENIDAKQVIFFVVCKIFIALLLTFIIQTLYFQTSLFHSLWLLLSRKHPPFGGFLRLRGFFRIVR